MIIQYVIDYQDTETLISSSKPIPEGNAHVLSSSKNKIWYLGLIEKRLSPPHSKDNTSL